jgi:hypothetical protein
VKWKNVWSKTKVVTKRAFKPAKYKGVRVTSDAAEVVIKTPKYLLFGKK